MNIFFMGICFLQFLICYQLVASQNNEKLTMNSMQEHQSMLYRYLIDDCHPISNNGYNQQLTTQADVMNAKRLLNQGFLPLSKIAKKNITQYLYVNYVDNEKDARDALQSISQIYSLHPLSVQKIHEALDYFYAPREEFDGEL